MKNIVCLLFLVVIAMTAKAQEMFDHPLREISIIASETGYYPAAPTAFVGEKVRFFVTTTTEEKRCLLLPEKSVFLSMEKGRIDEGEFIATAPGVYKFHCPTGKLEGFLTVLLKPADKKRELASEAQRRVRVWFPKDKPQD